MALEVDKSLVTAVITTHNREARIVERALRSVLSQTYHNIETIVVDDSSADFSERQMVAEMIQRYSEKNVCYIRHQKCLGACAARNSGLMNANGEFVAFLDDDDEWLPLKIERELSGFISGDTALVYCETDTIDDDTNNRHHASRMLMKGYIYEALIAENFIGSTSFPLLRTSALKAIGGFDTEMKSAQDYDVWLRIAEKYEVNYVSETLALYHVHFGEQISKNPANRIAGLERLNEKNIEYLRNHPNAYGLRVIKIAPFYAMAGQTNKAFETWWKAVRIWPWAIKRNVYYLAKIIVKRG